MSLLGNEKVEINDKDYRVTESNFYNNVYVKKQIVLGNTFSRNMNHYIGWMVRDEGNSKKTTPYTIDKHGEIFEHFNPECYSDFTNHKAIDKKIIPILLENEGYLFSDIKKGNVYYDYLGRIFTGDEIITKRWRGHTYWAPYTKQQIESAVKLIKHLMSEFNIEKNVMGHNTKFDDIYNYNGVAYRSNYNTIFTDISPALDTIKFREDILKDD